MKNEDEKLFDFNGDGKVSKEELKVGIEVLHDMMDEAAEKAEKERKE